MDVSKFSKILVLISSLSFFSHGFAQTKTLSDAEIAHIVTTSNDLDIAAAKMAKSHTENKEVIKFADHMIMDHTANNQESKALAEKLKIVPQDNIMSAELKKNNEKKMASLASMKGKDFDKAYIDHQVTFHKSVIDSMDNSLIPDAKNAELKNLLTKTEPKIKGHLEHAMNLQKTMMK